MKVWAGRLLVVLFLGVLMMQLAHAEQYLVTANLISVQPWKLYFVLTLPLLFYGICCSHCRGMVRIALPILIPFLGVILLGFAGTLVGTPQIAGRYKESMIAPLGLYTFLVGLTMVGWLHERRLLRHFLLLSFVVSAISILVDVVLPGTFAVNPERAGGFGMNANTGAYICLFCLVGCLNWDEVERNSFADGLILALAFTAVYFTFARSGLVIFAAIVCVYSVWLTRNSGVRDFMKAFSVLLCAVVGVMALVRLAGSHVPLLKASSVRNAPFIAGTNYRLSERIEFLLGATQVNNPDERAKLARFYQEWSHQVGEKRPDNILFPSIAREHRENVRLLLIYRTCELVVRRPLFGWGTGFSASLVMKPHNMYLAKWADNGIFALICYLWLLAALLVVNWRFRSIQGITLTVALGLMGIFSQNCFELKAAFLPLAISLGMALSRGAHRTPAQANPYE